MQGRTAVRPVRGQREMLGHGGAVSISRCGNDNVKRIQYAYCYMIFNYRTFMKPKESIVSFRL
jgi:hypothetical protein